MTEGRATLLSVEQAWEQLNRNVPDKRPDTEILPVMAAIGRVLVMAPSATVDVPATNKSAMDGFAVNTRDVARDDENGRRLRISQRVAAGDVAAPLVAGTAARIFTGAMLPPGADCVVIQENCQYDEHHVTLQRGLKKHANIRLKGEDIGASDVLLQSAHEIRPQDIGLLISAGIREVTVYKKLQVAVIATGDELLDIDAPPQPEKIYESNAPMVAAMLERMGCHAKRYRAADTLADTLRVLEKASGENDAVITIGGVSVGEEDHVQAAMQQLGEVDFWKIRIKPGKPFLFGTAANVPVLGLPGNPVSSFVTFGMFCRPFLNKLRGAVFRTPPTWTANAGFSLSRKSDRQEYLRGQVERINGTKVIRRLSAQGSGMQSALCAAEVFIVVPPDTLINDGQAIEVISMDDFVA